MSISDDAIIVELVINDLIAAFGPVSVDSPLSQAIDELRSPELRQLTDLHNAIVMRRAIEIGLPAPHYQRQLQRIINDRT